MAALLAFETSTDTFYKTSAPASNERARAASEALAGGIVKREESRIQTWLQSIAQSLIELSSLFPGPLVTQGQRIHAYSTLYEKIDRARLLDHLGIDRLKQWNHNKIDLSFKPLLVELEFVKEQWGLITAPVFQEEFHIQERAEVLRLGWRL